MQKLFFIGLLVAFSVGCFAQKQIKQYEYWFDNNDQAKTIASITPSTSFTLNTSASTSGLPEGLHTFRIRFQDVSGVWSATDNQFFNKMPNYSNNVIAKYEYWFDNDYAGKKVETVASGDSFSLVRSIATGNMIGGLHAFHIRFQDKKGAWSITTNQFFYKMPIISNNVIKKYEYWFDNDYASKKGETITANDSISLVSTIATGNLPEGLHIFQIRFQDKAGAWSVPSIQLFTNTTLLK